MEIRFQKPVPITEIAKYLKALTKAGNTRLFLGSRETLVQGFENNTFSSILYYTFNPHAGKFRKLDSQETDNITLMVTDNSPYYSTDEAEIRQGLEALAENQ